MIDFLTPESVANAVRFSRTAKPQSAALLLEGTTDIKFYRNLADEKRCEFYFAKGKTNVLKTLANLEASRTHGVVAVVDADSDHLEGCVSKRPNVITTEVKDIEGILLRSPALEKVLNEAGLSNPKLAIRDLAINAARSLGYLRWLSERKNWTIDFKTLNFTAFVDGKRIECDDKRMIAEVLRANPKFGLNGEELWREVNLLADRGHDGWHVASGHDATKILSVAIQAHSGKVIPPTLLESQLRLAFEMAFFTGTALYIAICTWQRNNTPFVILRIDCPS